MIKGNTQLLRWFENNMSTLHDANDYFFMIVDFDADDYYKISNHRIGHSYTMFELLTDINVMLWGGSDRKFEVIEDFNRTISIYKNKYHKRGEKVRIAILKVTKRTFILDEYYDIK